MRLFDAGNAEGDMNEAEFAAALKLSYRCNGYGAQDCGKTQRLADFRCQCCNRRTLYSIKPSEAHPPKTCGRLRCMVASGEMKPIGV